MYCLEVLYYTQKQHKRVKQRDLLLGWQHQTALLKPGEYIIAIEFWKKLTSSENG
jgi:hypothetical protein